MSRVDWRQKKINDQNEQFQYNTLFLFTDKLQYGLLEIIKMK